MRQAHGLAVAIVLLSSACSEKEPPLSDPPAKTTDTGETFALSLREKAEKEALALGGDAAAAMSLAQHYGMAGGDAGQTADPENSISEDRWLRVAVANGYEPARIRLATKILHDDCAQGRELLRAIAQDSTDSETRQSAQDWLSSAESTCHS